MDHAARPSTTPSTQTAQTSPTAHDRVSEADGPSTLDVPGTWNVRDVGRPPRSAEHDGAGPDDAAGPGPTLRDGVLFRSASLSTLTPEGVEILERLGVSAVLDLRGDHEVERDGADVLPARARQVRLPFGDLGRSHGETDTSQDAGGAPADPREMLVRLATSDDPAAAGETLMRRLYAGFVSDPAALEAVAVSLETLAAEPGAVLVHCSAGKDRTGWVVAVVQLLCGVPRDAVLAEYLRSASSAATLAATLPDVPEVDPAFWSAFTTVRPAYLETALDAVRDTYGTLDAYVEAAGVTPEVVAAVRARLVLPGGPTG